MLQYLLISLLISTPDPSTRTHAWRVVDQVSGSYRCEYACSTSAVDAARDTACIQSALEVVSASAGVKWNALELPSGVCHISAALKVSVAVGVNGGFEIFGHGPPWTTNRGIFADSSWNSDTVIRGTVLRSSLTTGAVLTLGTDTTITAVNAGTNVITLASATHFSVNDWVTFRDDLDSAAPAPISTATGYYIKTKSGDDITISATLGGATFDVTSWAGVGTTHVTNSPGGRWLLHDFAILGSGDTDVKGLQVVGGSGIALVDMQGVTFANLAVGLDLATAEDGTIDGLAFYGNSVGFLGDTTTNSNTWTGIDCSANTTCGILKGSVNSLFGGTVQGSSKYGLRFVGGSENQVTGIYFEDQTATGAAISSERTGSWIIRSIASNTLTLDGAAPADDTEVFVFVDGSSSTLPGGISDGVTYYVANSSGVTCKLRTAPGGGGSLVGSSSGTGNVRMTVIATEAGYNAFTNNHFGASGDDVSLWRGNDRFEARTMAQSVTIHKTVSGVTVETPQGCTDGGVGSVCESFSNGGLHYDFTNPVVASPGISLETAASLFFGMQTAAGMEFHWECRDALGYCQFRDTVNDTAYLTLNPHNAGTADDEVAVKAHNLTVDYAATISGTLTCNTIESTGAGTAVEGVTINNGRVDGVDVSVLNAYVAPCTAVGDGVTDDTVALQACIDATPVGGTLFLPEGVYLITSGLTVANAIEIVGQGTASNTTASVYAFGNASWAGATFRGTVLKSALASGTMLQMVNNDPRFVVRNIAFWGTDDGADSTLIGLSVATNGGQMPRPIIENVGAFNLKTGVKCTACTAGSFRDVYLAGNSVGMDLSSSSDAGNVIENPRVVTNVTGIKLTGALDTNIVGGYFSANTTALDLLGARASTITGIQFTSNTTGIVIEKSGGGGTGTGGDQNTISGCQFISNDPVSIYGNGNRLTVTGITASPAITLQSGATYNFVEYLGGVGGSYTDSSGQQNFKFYQSANGLEFYDSAAVTVKAGNITASTAYVDGIADQGGATSFVSLDQSTHAITIQGPGGVAINSGNVTLGTGVSLVTPAAGNITSATSLTLDTPMVYCGAAGVGDLTCDDITAGDLSGTKLTQNGAGGGNTPRILCNSAPGTCTTANCTTTGTSIETVATCNVPALSGGSDGDTITIDAVILKDADANSVTFEIDHTVGGTPVEQMVAQAQSTANLSWVIHLELVRDSSTTMFYTKSFTTNSPSLQASTYVAPGNNAWTWANSNNGFVVRLTTGVAAGDAAVKLFRVTYHPAVTSP